MTRGRVRSLTTAIAAAGAALAVAACGSGASAGSGAGGSGTTASSNPQTLLEQTFSAANAVKSGRLGVKIVIVPTGSSLITTPVTLDLSGPFVQGSRGQAPQSDLTVSFNGLGKHASFGVLTTQKAAYISLQGTSYKLPQASFQKLEASFSNIGPTSAHPIGLKAAPNTVTGSVCDHISKRGPASPLCSADSAW